jgi:hypothetical protein
VRQEINSYLIRISIMLSVMLILRHSQYLDYITSNEWMMMNWKGLWRKQSWPIICTVPQFACRNWGKSQETSRIAAVRAMIWTQQLPNTSVWVLPLLQSTLRMAEAMPPVPLCVHQVLGLELALSSSVLSGYPESADYSFRVSCAVFWLRFNTLAYRPVDEHWLCKQLPFLGNGSVSVFPLLGSRFLIIQQLDATVERLCFLYGPCRAVINKGSYELGHCCFFPFLVSALNYDRDCICCITNYIKLSPFEKPLDAQLLKNFLILLCNSEGLYRVPILRQTNPILFL